VADLVDPVWPTATTRAAGVIGQPIRHSLSPTLYNAAFRAIDLDWAFLAFDVAPGEGGAAIDAARVLGLDGLAVTMPHKEGVIPALDRLSPTAAALGAVNVVVREGSELVGDSTDGSGFIDALHDDEGYDPAGRTCAVIGAGGAARAVVRALAEARAAEIVVINRTPERAEAAVALAGGVGRVGRDAAIRDAELVVNSTPVGMAHMAGMPFDPDLLRDGQLVVDLIYHPPVTPLLVAARQRKLTAVNGLGMLIHQAARSFRLWTGHDAPLEAMSAAAVGVLARERDRP
jgi:shikimate dehydrogenase